VQLHLGMCISPVVVHFACIVPPKCACLALDREPSSSRQRTWACRFVIDGVWLKILCHPRRRAQVSANWANLEVGERDIPEPKQGEVRHETTARVCWDIFGIIAQRAITTPSQLCIQPANLNMLAAAIAKVDDQQ
jgi:hypothetical protein